MLTSVLLKLRFKDKVKRNIFVCHLLDIFNTNLQVLLQALFLSTCLPRKLTRVVDQLMLHRKMSGVDNNLNLGNLTFTLKTSSMRN